MEIQHILAPGLILLKRPAAHDQRGFFQKSYSAESLGNVWKARKIEQVNRSYSKEAGTFRGLHLQLPPFADAKLIQCLRGRVLDMAVDVRKGSPTFLQTFYYELSEENHVVAMLEEGFAHGFQTLEPDSELLYIHSAPYVTEAEYALNYLDPRLKINLPLPTRTVSDRDKGHAFLEPNFLGIEF